MNVKEIVEKYADEAIEIRHRIHQNPELSYEEFETTKLIRSELTRYGVEIEPLDMETGVVGIVRGAKSGKTVMIREDIDALPLQEETGLPFASKRASISHACGHDIHTATLLLIARVMAEKKDELCGNVRFVFQPAEEKASGAKDMIRAGFVKLEPKADVVIGAHVSADFPVGSVGLVRGPSSASTDGVFITVKGIGGHGAHPYRCVDPIVTSAYMLTQLQTIISRENPALQPAVLTFGSIHGGTALNIIPTEVKLAGTLRTFNEKGRRKMWDAIRRVAKSSCEAMRAEAEVTIEEGVPVLINSNDVIEGIAQAAEKIIGTENIFWVEGPSPGSDDFSCFLEFSAGAQFHLGSANEQLESKIGLHSPRSVFDDRAIPTGAAIMAQYAFDYLK